MNILHLIGYRGGRFGTAWRMALASWRCSRWHGLSVIDAGWGALTIFSDYMRRGK